MFGCGQLKGNVNYRLGLVASAMAPNGASLLASLYVLGYGLDLEICFY